MGTLTEPRDSTATTEPTATSVLGRFGAATRAWFSENFDAPTRIQQLGWPTIEAGEHALLIAPTGSGKTLAAFLTALDTLCLATKASDDAPRGYRTLYLSPLKALAADIDRNLRSPLIGIQRTATRLGHAATPIRVDVRTGDTPTKLRQEQLRDPGDILVTTPESLFLLLGSRAGKHLESVTTIIVDEVHSMAGTKRGAHLALSLERLAARCERDPQRIGLSATVEPAAIAARWLGGDRPVTILDAAEVPNLDLTIILPEETEAEAEDDAATGPPASDANTTIAAAPPPIAGSILGNLYAEAVSGAPTRNRERAEQLESRLLPLLSAHRATIVFVNSRGLCERLVTRINEAAGEDWVAAHHGSVSHARRTELEERLKTGAIRGLVATSSLELGVDMGAVDLVVLVESPGAVSRGLQRAGRAGHGVGETSRCLMIPRRRNDLIECAVLGAEMRAGHIETLSMPRCPLDVLAQQIVAMTCEAPTTLAEVLALAKRSGPFAELSEDLLVAVLDMLSGHYPSSDLADLRPWIAWDQAENRLTPRKGAALAARMNAGTIPDRGQYRVRIGDTGPRVGELDEEMVHELRVGEAVTLGASTWRVEDITRDEVRVTPAPGEVGKLPFWRGDGPGRPFALALSMLETLAALEPLSSLERLHWLHAETPLSNDAARALAGHIDEQQAACGVLPGPQRIVVERFRDELGDWRLCIHAPFGTPVLIPWALALQHRLALETGYQLQILHTDDGLVLRVADGETLPDLDRLFPDPATLEDAVTEQLAQSAVFAARFRENAARALLLVRNRPQTRQPLWMQRIKAQQLLAAVQRHERFPVVLETYRELLSDVFDLATLKRLLGDVQRRRIEIVEVETRAASPFARALAFAFVSAYMYDGDAPLAERRAQALSLDRRMLTELLGHADLRELLDGAVIEQLEAELAACSNATALRDADDLFDLLRRRGDLGTAELAVCHVRADPTSTDHPTPVDCDDAPPRDANAAPNATRIDDWLRELAAARRIATVRIAGEARWIAAVDAGLYRDALGTHPPPGLPDRYLETRERPLETLLLRFAAGRGPFPASAFLRRYVLDAAQLREPLATLLAEGQLVEGELRPGGQGLEICHAEVLRRVKRGTLAASRNAVAAVDGATFARFLCEWQHLPATLSSRHRAMPRLPEVLSQLEGYVAPWSTWRDVILPSRCEHFRIDALDLLIARGEFVWQGQGALGPKDARVRFLRRAVAAIAIDPETLQSDDQPAAEQALLDRLRHHGASFYLDLQRAWDAPSAKAGDAVTNAPYGALPPASTPTIPTSEANAVAAPGAGDPKTTPATLDTTLDTSLARLLWDGLVTNDTLGPLRALGGPAVRRPRRAAGPLSQRRLASPRTGDAGGRADTTTTLVGARSRLLASLRRGPSGASPGRAHPAAALAGGRYTATEHLLDSGSGARGIGNDDIAAATRLAADRALVAIEMLLERYGFVCREIVQAENLPGGFAAFYPWLKQLEDHGELRRGYFIEGLSGAQFARGHAIDRLRATERATDVIAPDSPSGVATSGVATSRPSTAGRDESSGWGGGFGNTANRGDASSRVRWLATPDPAQPWGRILPWPESAPAREQGRLRNVAGSWVGLVDGAPRWYVATAGRRACRLLSAPPDAVEAVLWQAFSTEVASRGNRRGLRITHIDDAPIRETPWFDVLQAAGGASEPDGLRFGP